MRAVKYSDAKPIFEKTRIGVYIREKANIRLGNIAEMEGRWDDAKQYYSGIMKINPTQGQFNYANFSVG